MSFEVRLIPSGRTYTVQDGERILEAGFSSGVKLPNGCRMGTCKTCAGKIVEGRVDLGGFHSAYLTQEMRNEGYALLCQAKPLSDVAIEVEELPFLPDPQTLPTYVKSITMMKPDIAVLKLRLPLHANMPFVAGQYIDILLPDGQRRAYSIANPPRPEGVIDIELHIRHMPGGLFTDQLFGGVKERDKFQFEGPFGTFFLRDSDKPVIFLATGTGYAPIRAILLETMRWGSSRPMTLYWGDRTLADLYMIDEARQLAEQNPNFKFVPVLSRGTAAQGWTGRTGYVQNAALADIADVSNYQIYACGSPSMIAAAERDFVARGLPRSEFFADAFFTAAELAAEDLTKEAG